MPNPKKTIADLFEENELKVSVLYRLYANNLAGHKKFWERIADEEIIHAKQIAELDEEVKKCFVENNFSRGVIQYVTDYVEKQIQAARTKKYSHIEALNIALRVEQSMLEKKSFELFMPTNVTLQQVLRKLNNETQRHLQMLQKELKKQF